MIEIQISTDLAEKDFCVTAEQHGIGNRRKTASIKLTISN